MKMCPYVDDWEDIWLHLSKPFPIQGSTILESFWPFNNWKLNYAKAKLLSTTSVINSKDLVICPYCGPMNLKWFPHTPYLEISYTLFKNFNNEDFVFVKVHDIFLVLVWLGRTHSDVVKDDQNEFFKMMRVWVPVKKGSNSNERHLYEDCWNGKWKCNLVDPE